MKAEKLKHKSKKNNLYDLLERFPDEASCIAHLEQLRWGKNVVSPFDPESKVYVCKGNKYRCKNTGKYFNIRTATVFEHSKISLRKWLMVSYLFSAHKKGISSHQIARDCGITQKSAWFMLHRLRFAVDGLKSADKLEGRVEADECYIGGKLTNKHESQKPKLDEKRKPKAIALGILERKGEVRVFHVPDAKTATIVPLVHTHVKQGSFVMTDEWHAYYALQGPYTHYRVPHGQKIFVRGMAHTNGIENFWSLLQRGIIGVYHYTSTQHLQAYLSEYAFRFNLRNVSDDAKHLRLLTNTEGRLKYKHLINKKTIQHGKPS